MKRGLREELFEIIFEADTRSGKIFDVAILIAIVLSILTVMLESVPSYSAAFTRFYIILEWIFTCIFTLEYLLRIYAARKRLNYIFSFYGIIDLLAILPVYLGLFIACTRSFLIIRALRLLRIFRIFKVSRYMKASEVLATALRGSMEKISVFLFTVMMLVLLIGTLMYMIEGEVNGFTSIPKSVYWAIVTLTTVGYGDITPQTPLGQFFSALLMITGYAIIAVPTGIISVEIARSEAKVPTTQVCPECLKEGHTHDATYCKYCGAELNP